MNPVLQAWKALSGVSARVSVASDNAARLEHYARAWDAYFGRLPKALKSARDGIDDSVNVNYARLIVDVNVTMLFGQEPIFETDGESGDSSPATDALDACWAANKKMILLQKVAQNGSTCGHAFIRILPPRFGEEYPRLINLSPEYVRVIVDPQDIDQVEAYLIEYDAVDSLGRNVSVRQTIQRRGAIWEILEQSRFPDNSQLDTERVTVWNYSFPPIVDCQNLPLANSYYGLSDIEDDIIDLNQSVNFIASNIRRIIRFHAHPKTWGTGISAKEVNTSPDSLLIFANPDAQIGNLEMQGDLSSSLAYYEKLQGAMFDVARLPAVATGQLDKAGDLSGTAMQIAYRPLSSVIDQKRLTYGEMLTKLNGYLLEMMGVAADKPITIQWPEILPVNNLEDRQVALIDQQIGASRDTLLWKLGYDAEQEAKKKADEDAAALEQQARIFDAGMGDAAGAYGANEQRRGVNRGGNQPDTRPPA